MTNSENFENLKLVSKARQLANAMKSENVDIINRGFNKEFNENVCTLMSYIFTIWTLEDSEYFFKHKKREDEEKSNVFGINDSKRYLREPKITQIVAILILLSIDNPNRKLLSNLVQIGTGEGKSLILAVLACILSLLGFDVYCVCYGTLLTKRDSAAFENLFQTLHVEHCIEYGTYDELCETLIEENIPEEDVLDVLLSKNLNNNNSEFESKESEVEQKKNRILLIDEVDVFFDERYFGQNFRWSVTLRDKCISNICDLIWNNDESKKKHVWSSKAYLKCREKFPKWMPLIDIHIKEMMRDVKEAKKANQKHNYVLFNDKIGYKDNDIISTTTYWGYETLFMYYKEYEKLNISANSLREAKAMQITVAEFSYAEIPVSFNNIIVGVTATLSTLTDSDKSILRDVYNINNYS